MTPAPRRKWWLRSDREDALAHLSEKKEDDMVLTKATQSVNGGK